jgi:hypothetical protein
MVAIGKQPSPARQCPIDGSRHAHREALQPQRQSATVLCFRDQMQVIALYREVDEAEPEAFSTCSERKPYFAEEPFFSQRGDTSGDPKGDVHRMTVRQ